MLKSKKAIYILIPLNIAIWGYFIFRFYNIYNGNDISVLTEKVSTIKLLDIKDSITYKLSLDYADPFLKDAVKQKSFQVESPSDNKNNIKRLEPKPVKTATITVIPKPTIDIKYFGLVKNSNGGNSTALVTFNGQSKLIKVNDLIDGVTFKSFNKDSLVAKNGKETIIVRR